jgi:hypothetical protein
MTDLYPTFGVVLAVAAVLTAVGLRVRPGRVPKLTVEVLPEDAELADRVGRAVAWRVRVAAFVGVGVSVLTLLPLGAVMSGIAGSGNPYRLDVLRFGPPPIFGFLLAFAPLAGGIAAVLVVFVSPKVGWPAAGALRTADLVIRGSDRLLRRLLVGLGAALGALALFAVSTAVTARYGFDGTFTSALLIANRQTTNTGAYPGWSFAAGVIGVGLIVVALVWVTIQRVQRAAGVGRSRLRSADEALRNVLSRSVALFGLSAIGASLGFLIWSVGATTLTAARFPIVGHCRSVGQGAFTCHQVGLISVQPALTFGLIEAGVGVVLLAAALTVIVVAVRQSRIVIGTASAAELVQA